jgi:hypothetical protein
MHWQFAISGYFLLLATVSAGFMQPFCLHPATAATKDTQQVRDGEELNAIEKLRNHEIHFRACKEYFCAENPGVGVALVARAPDWSVEEISPKRKLYSITPFKEFLRRGVPANFLVLSQLQDWPTVRKETREVQDFPVTAFAMPYLTPDRKIVPLKRGSVGELLVYTGFNTPAIGQIQARLLRIPWADGLTLSMHVWLSERNSAKYNSIFIYSGSKPTQTVLELKKIWTEIQHPLPSTRGYKLCKDSHEIWVDKADTEGFNELLK